MSEIRWILNDCAVVWMVGWAIVQQFECNGCDRPHIYPLIKATFITIVLKISFEGSGIDLRGVDLLHCRIVRNGSVHSQESSLAFYSQSSNCKGLVDANDSIQWDKL